MFTVLASDVLEKAIGEDQNGGDGVGFFLDLSSNPPLMELVLLNTAVSTNPWRAEGINLGKGLGIAAFEQPGGSYKYVKASREFPLTLEPTSERIVPALRYRPLQ